MITIGSKSGINVRSGVAGADPDGVASGVMWMKRGSLMGALIQIS